MKLTISLEETLVIGSVVCAVLIALGITLGNVDVLKGGVVIVSLCGGTVIVKVLAASKSNRRERDQ